MYSYPLVLPYLQMFVRIDCHEARTILLYNQALRVNLERPFSISLHTPTMNPLVTTSGSTYYHDMDIGVLLEMFTNTLGHFMNVRMRDNHRVCRIALVNRNQNRCFGWFLATSNARERITFDQDLFDIELRADRLRSMSDIVLSFDCRMEITKMVLEKEVNRMKNKAEITYIFFKRRVFVDPEIRLHRNIIPSDRNVGQSFEKVIRRLPNLWSQTVINRYNVAFREIFAKVSRWIHFHPELAFGHGQRRLVINGAEFIWDPTTHRLTVNRDNMVLPPRPVVIPDPVELVPPIVEAEAPQMAQVEEDDQDVVIGHEEIVEVEVELNEDEVPVVEMVREPEANDVNMVQEIVEFMAPHEEAMAPEAIDQLVSVEELERAIVEIDEHDSIEQRAPIEEVFEAMEPAIPLEMIDMVQHPIVELDEVVAVHNEEAPYEQVVAVEVSQDPIDESIGQSSDDEGEEIEEARALSPNGPLRDRPLSESSFDTFRTAHNPTQLPYVNCYVPHELDIRTLEDDIDYESIQSVNIVPPVMLNGKELDRHEKRVRMIWYTEANVAKNRPPPVQIDWTAFHSQEAEGTLPHDPSLDEE